MVTHSSERRLPYTAEQLFDLVADVERYPEFVPWWVAARVRERQGDIYYTDQVVRFSFVSQRFQSKTALMRPTHIQVISDDRIFRHLAINWAFEAQAGGGCSVTLSMSCELRSRTLQSLSAGLLAAAPGRLITAFETRASRLFGDGPAVAIARAKTSKRPLDR